jgi:hypothetical protein
MVETYFAKSIPFLLRIRVYFCCSVTVEFIGAEIAVEGIKFGVCGCDLGFDRWEHGFLCRKVLGVVDVRV